MCVCLFVVLLISVSCKCSPITNLKEVDENTQQGNEDYKYNIHENSSTSENATPSNEENKNDTSAAVTIQTQPSSSDKEENVSGFLTEIQATVTQEPEPKGENAGEFLTELMPTVTPEPETKGKNADELLTEVMPTITPEPNEVGKNNIVVVSNYSDIEVNVSNSGSKINENKEIIINNEINKIQGPGIVWINLHEHDFGSGSGSGDGDSEDSEAIPKGYGGTDCFMGSGGGEHDGSGSGDGCGISGDGESSGNGFIERHGSKENVGTNINDCSDTFNDDEDFFIRCIKRHYPVPKPGWEPGSESSSERNSGSDDFTVNPVTTDNSNSKTDTTKVVYEASDSGGESFDDEYDEYYDEYYDDDNNFHEDDFGENYVI